MQKNRVKGAIDVEKMTGAMLIIKSLESEGVDTLFGYPGGAVLPLYDALGDSRIRHILVRGEQAAAHAANGYARSSGRPGVCLATSGPGATNLITGIATAYMDSVPLVAITGQVPRERIGSDAFQEVDITGATEPFTKHNYLVKNVEDLPRIIKEAFYIARTGRPGPVLIDIPTDVQQATTDRWQAMPLDLPGYKPTVAGHPGQVKKLAELLNKSKRPLIIAGGGIVAAGAKQALRTLSEQVGIPVATTFMGIGAIATDHPLSLGMIGGQHGVHAATLALEEADVLLVIGARMADRATGATGGFGHRATIAHVDVDPAEIGKNVRVDLPIVGDAKNILEQLQAERIHRSGGGWIEKVTSWKKIHHGVGRISGGVHPMKALQQIGRRMPADTIVVTDVGQHQMWAGRYLAIKEESLFLSSGGLGTMGYGLPAAIGAKVANPDREVILITGDGSFQMAMAELATASAESASIKVFLFNNNHLGMVRELQDHFCEQRHRQVHLKGNPDFSIIASAYGFEGRRVIDDLAFSEALPNVFRGEQTVLLDLMVSPDAAVIPRKGDEVV